MYVAGDLITGLFAGDVAERITGEAGDLPGAVDPIGQLSGGVVAVADGVAVEVGLGHQVATGIVVIPPGQAGELVTAASRSSVS